MLSQGRVRDFDSRRNLLQKEKGLFSRMVAASGREKAQDLRKQLFGIKRRVLLGAAFSINS